MLQSFAFRSPLLGRLSRRPAWNRPARDLTGLSPSGLRLQLAEATPTQRPDMGSTQPLSNLGAQRPSSAPVPMTETQDLCQCETVPPMGLLDGVRCSTPDVRRHALDLRLVADTPDDRRISLDRPFR